MSAYISIEANMFMQGFPLEILSTNITRTHAKVPERFTTTHIQQNFINETHFQFL